MAREIEILSLSPSGHVLFQVTDTDGVFLKLTTSIPVALLAGPTIEAAENVKDYLEANWPTKALNHKRSNVNTDNIVAAIGPKFTPRGTAEEAKKRLDARRNASSSGGQS